jgi:hypothetical protein
MVYSCQELNIMVPRFSDATPRRAVGPRAPQNISLAQVDAPPESFPFQDLPVELQRDVIAWMPLEPGGSCQAMASTSRFYFELLRREVGVVQMCERTRQIETQASMTRRLIQFDHDLWQVATMPPPLRACALAALAARLPHLRRHDRFDAFLRVISSLSEARLHATDRDDLVACLAAQLVALPPCAGKVEVVQRLAEQLANVGSRRLGDILRLMAFHVCAGPEERPSPEVAASLIACSQRAPVELFDTVMRAICACVLTLPYSHERAKVFESVLHAAISRKQGGSVQIRLLACLCSYLGCMLSGGALVNATLALTRNAATLHPEAASDILARLGAGLCWVAEDHRLPAFDTMLSASDSMDAPFRAEVLASIANRLTLLRPGPDRVQAMLGLLRRLVRLPTRESVPVLGRLTIAFDALPSSQPAAKLVRALLDCLDGLEPREQFPLQMKMVRHLRSLRRGSETARSYCLLLDAALRLRQSLPAADRLLRQLACFVCFALDGDALAYGFEALSHATKTMSRDDRRIVLRNAFESLAQRGNDEERMRCFATLLRHIAAIESNLGDATPDFLIDQVSRMPPRLARAACAIALREASHLSTVNRRRGLLCRYVGTLSDLCRQQATQLFNPLLESVFDPALSLPWTDQLEVLGDMAWKIASLQPEAQEGARAAIRSRLEALPPGCRAAMQYRMVVDRLASVSHTTCQKQGPSGERERGSV